MARVFITGSSTGLGLLSARWLEERGHQVTLHARNAQRTDESRAALPHAPVVVGDLSRIDEMRRVAEQVNALDRHDAVIHNAAVYRVPNRLQTDDGLSLTFAVNVLAPYVLTALVERPDRLVYMTSGLQKGAAHDLDDAQWTRRRWDWLQAYSESKLLVTTLAFGIAQRWPAVRSNAVSPGWVPTRMGGASASDDLALGAETQAWLAAGDDPAADVTGQYLFHRQRSDVPAAVRDPRAQEALFAHCAELTGHTLG
jgi:NAD(P)-dependent dehydrogenase (short-subunit alcohol dehydrogenase family)